MNFFTGFLIGVVSLIPGISGGTILVITKKYNEVANAISNYRKKENLSILFSLILGIILGTITFARIVEFMFYFVPNGTMIIFSGFILFNLPNIFKEQIKKPNLFFIFIGMLIIFLVSSSSNHVDKVIFDYPNINITFLIYFTLYGCIDGFFTIIPGISGSMMMMILGPYFLYKSFLANLNFDNIIFILPLFFYFIGDLIGFFLGSKFSLYFIKKHYHAFFNIIFGMVLMSAIILLPIPSLNFNSIISYAIFLIISYIIYSIINLVS